MNYYKIAKTAYCTEGDQFDCRDCELCNYFEEHNYDSTKCRQHLIMGLVEEIEELKHKLIFKKE